MDKRSFIKEAPEFYALAIAVSLLAANPRHGQVHTMDQLEGNGGFSFYGPLLEAGMRILENAGVAETVKQVFGPPLYRRMPDLTQQWLSRVDHEIPIFRTYSGIKNQTWLQQAITDVNEHYSSLKISPSDFDEPLPDVWAPLPLDRSDSKLIEATAKVDAAIAEIEADNGYAVNVPGERDYVLHSLKSFSKTLKEEAQITGMQIKTFAIDPLTVVTKRFAGAALSLVAGAAKEAILNWLKAKFGEFLGSLFS
jgi:hypothetical protein